MALSIPQESNDDLVVKLLRIATIAVHFDDLQFVKNEYSDLVLKPTSALVALSDYADNETEPTDDQMFAVRQWVAGKVGVDADNVQIA